MKTVPVQYLGERVGIRGKVIQSFRDTLGELYHFSGIKGVFFGSWYEMLEDGKMHRRPKELSGDEPSDKDWKEFETNKIGVKAFRLQSRKAMQLKKPHEDIVRAVALLKPFYQSVDRFTQKRFMDWVCNEMSKPNKKRKKR